MSSKIISALTGLGIFIGLCAHAASMSLFEIQSLQKLGSASNDIAIQNQLQCEKIIFDQYRFYSATTSDFTIIRYIAEYIPNNCAGTSLNIEGSRFYLPSGELSTSDYSYRIAHELERRYGENWMKRAYVIQHKNKPDYLVSGGGLVVYLNKNFNNRKVEVIYINQQ